MKKLFISFFLVLVIVISLVFGVNAQCPPGDTCDAAYPNPGSCTNTHEVACGAQTYHYGTEVSQEGFCRNNPQISCYKSRTCCLEGGGPNWTCSCGQGYYCNQSQNYCSTTYHFTYQACDAYSTCSGVGGGGCNTCESPVVYRCHPPQENCSLWPDSTFCQPGDTACTTDLNNCQAACNVTPPPGPTATPYPTQFVPTNTPRPPPDNCEPNHGSCINGNLCNANCDYCGGYYCSTGVCCQGDAPSITPLPGETITPPPPPACEGHFQGCGGFSAEAHGVAVYGDDTNPPTLDVAPGERIDFIGARWVTDQGNCSYPVQAHFDWGDGTSCLERTGDVIRDTDCDPAINIRTPIYFCDGGRGKVFSQTRGGTDSWNSYNSPPAPIVTLADVDHCTIGRGDPNCEPAHIQSAYCPMPADGITNKPDVLANDRFTTYSYSAANTYLVRNYTIHQTGNNQPPGQNCKINIHVVTTPPPPAIVIQGRVVDYGLDPRSCTDNQSLYANGETVVLKTAPNGPPVAQVTTEPYYGLNGAFRFLGVAPGSYYVCPVRGYCQDYFCATSGYTGSNWDAATNCMYLPDVTSTVGGIRLMESQVCVDPQISCRYDLYNSNFNTIPIQMSWPGAAQQPQQQVQVRKAPVPPNNFWWWNNWMTNLTTIRSKDNLSPTPGYPPAIPNGDSVQAKACFADCNNQFRDHFSSWSAPVQCLTPTPLPSPTPTQGPWSKIANGSFQTHSGVFNNSVPPPGAAVAFDGDDPGHSYFIDAVPGGSYKEGVATLNQISGMSVNQISLPTWNTVPGHPYSNQFDPTRFYNYVKSRKQLKEITNLLDIDNARYGYLYYYKGAPAPMNDPPNGQKAVIIVKNGSTITLGNGAVNTFNTANIPFMLVGNLIQFDPQIKFANGLFIGNTVNTGVNPNLGLKIKGNLVVTQSAGLIMGRKWASNFTPSLFVVNDPQMYIDLLPYISTSVYDWKELQVVVPIPSHGPEEPQK